MCKYNEKLFRFLKVTIFSLSSFILFHNPCPMSLFNYYDKRFFCCIVFLLFLLIRSSALIILHSFMCQKLFFISYFPLKCTSHVFYSIIIIKSFIWSFIFQLFPSINPLLTKDRRCNKGTLWIGMGWFGESGWGMKGITMHSKSLPPLSPDYPVSPNRNESWVFTTTW